MINIQLKIVIGLKFHFLLSQLKKKYPSFSTSTPWSIIEIVSYRVCLVIHALNIVRD